MKVLVITSFNKKLYDDYAYRFFQTYNWPFDLHVYSEQYFAFNPYEVGVVVHELGEDCKNFILRNKARPFKNFLTDGVRFCYKVYSLIQASQTKNYDILIWVDADSVFYKPLTMEFIQQHLYESDKMMTYLGRPNYSECGFLFWNLKHKDTKDFFDEMKRMYNEDLIYKEKEQHDSYIWDVVRKKFEIERGTINKNIGDQKVGHVQARSVLGTLYDHTKGPRKSLGKSPEARI